MCRALRAVLDRKMTAEEAFVAYQKGF